MGTDIQRILRQFRAFKGEKTIAIPFILIFAPFQGGKGWIMKSFLGLRLSAYGLLLSIYLCTLLVNLGNQRPYMGEGGLV